MFIDFTFRRLHDDLNAKCQDEQLLNSKLYDVEKLNVVLATELKEVCHEKCFVDDLKMISYFDRFNENMTSN